MLILVQVIEKIGDEKNVSRALIYLPRGTGSDWLGETAFPACLRLRAGETHSGQAPHPLPQPNKHVGGVSDKDSLYFSQIDTSQSHRILSGFRWSHRFAGRPRVCGRFLIDWEGRRGRSSWHLGQVDVFLDSSSWIRSG